MSGAGGPLPMAVAPAASLLPSPQARVFDAIERARDALGLTAPVPASDRALIAAMLRAVGIPDSS